MSKAKNMITNNVVGVYGTLRVGHGNWSYFLKDHADLLEQNVVLRGFTMRTFGGYPAIFKSESMDDTVLLDLFDVENTPTDIVEDMDGMEIGAGYYRDSVELDDGRVIDVYIMPDSHKEWFPEDIPSGDWNVYTEERRYA